MNTAIVTDQAFIAHFGNLTPHSLHLVQQLMGFKTAEHGITDMMRKRNVIDCTNASDEFMIWHLAPVSLIDFGEEAELLLEAGYQYNALEMDGGTCPTCGCQRFHARYQLFDAEGKFLSDQSRCFDVCFSCVEVFESIAVDFPKSKESINTHDEDLSHVNGRNPLTVTSPARPMDSMPVAENVGA